MEPGRPTLLLVQESLTAFSLISKHNGSIGPNTQTRRSCPVIWAEATLSQLPQFQTILTEWHFSAKDCIGDAGIQMRCKVRRCLETTQELS